MSVNSNARIFGKSPLNASFRRHLPAAIAVLAILPFVIDGFLPGEFREGGCQTRL